MECINLFTIGFTKKNAERFFALLKNNKVKKIIDVRLNNISQLAGFTKKDDLKFFLKQICDIDYYHVPDFAPTEDILKRYKNKEINWEQYEKEFIALIKQRKIENHIKLDFLNNACLLCTEPTAENCHRRLLAEYFSSIFPQVKVKHL